MKNFLLASICLLCNYVYADTTHVLFIGNSITYFNDMPQDFKEIALANQDTVDLVVYAPGGTGFVNHVDDPNVYDKFRAGIWDYIVLQPGSNESPGYSYPISETIDRGERLLDSIYLYNPCVSVLYYEISYGVWGSSANDLNTYNNTMDLIRTNLTSLSDSTQSFFAPVGEAFRYAWNQDQSTLLWGSAGDIHPNNIGSYLASCVFYASIFEKPSEGTNFLDGLTSSQATFYQHLADSIVLQHQDLWRRHSFEVSENFEFNISGGSVVFEYSDEFADSILWDFGDGGFSNLPAVSHIYDGNGTFNVNLTIYQHNCVHQISQTILIDELSLNILKKQEFRAYPNPTNGAFSLKGIEGNGFNYIVYDALGEVMESGTMNGNQIDLLSGIYRIEVRRNTGEFIWSDKVIVIKD